MPAAATLVALALGIVYAAIVAANDYLQLTTGRASLLAGETAGLDPLVWANPRSVFGERVTRAEPPLRLRGCAISWEVVRTGTAAQDDVWTPATHGA